MDPRILSPIPTPPAQRWREVRLLYLPRVAFALAILLIVWMWGGAVAPSAIVAEASIVGADLRANQAGVIASLKVSVGQVVRAGEVVGHVAAANPRLLDSTLAVIRAEVGMLTVTMAGATDRQRVALEFERMQLDWMSHRVERAALQGQLQQTESDLARAEPLHRAGLIAEETYGQLKIARNSLAAQLEEKSQLVLRLEPVLKGMVASDPKAAGLSGESALAAAIKVQEAKLRLAEDQLSPVPLIAPIDGVVGLTLRRAGETVVVGEVVLRVTATKPERVTGYLRQPLVIEPKPGMVAEIRTRTNPVKVAETTITYVGATLEAISPTVLAAMRLPPVPTPETALRVDFAIPSGLSLRPGEHVDVVIR
jgi:multidrug resistance efflux pump